ncbi:T6SS phospholipase effector Tle1-like catalytic domain-containing protein [Vibrio sp. M260112]|uniref:T6SS phospholipase effector Tle1-like catalytic domain-containing protein n=1 Tax=Vibrio sp. M260112 TaxID=3020895 RepID=UPI002F40A67A
MTFGALGVSEHCIPCESYTHWIEIHIRDEHNQPFPNIKGNLIDASGAVYPVTLGEEPIRLVSLAPGRVTLQFDNPTWLYHTQRRLPFDGETSPVQQWLKQNPAASSGASWTHHTLTLGDFVQLEQGQNIPKRHQKEALGVVKLVTNTSHFVTIQGCRYITLRLGMFFDGTANNSYSAKWGKARLEDRYYLWQAAYQVSEEIANTQDIHPTQFIEKCFDWADITGSAANELTNIQKLFDLYQSDSFNEDKTVYRYAQYITGIGTGNSTDIAKADEDNKGLAFGLGKYGIINKVRTGIYNVCFQLENILDDIAKRDNVTCDGFSKLEFDVFGFSRGAAAARHCINSILLGKNGEFAPAFIDAMNKQQDKHTLITDFDWESNQHCEVMFAGLFDTVAAYGIAHNDNDEPVRLWLDPARVRKAVHLVANKHSEYRYNFSLNRLNSAPHFDEIVLPGAHSDIGGGYHSRVAFSNADYLLPLLENKRIASVQNTELSLFGQKKQLAALTTELEQALDIELKHGWLWQDYLLTNPELTYEGKYTSGATAHLLYRKCTEGDLSRLYLRVMYGLAEFAGVPVYDKPEGPYVWNCQESKQDAHLYYPVQSQLAYPYQPQILPFDFGLLCQRVLDLAKAGEVVNIQKLLGSTDMLNNFIALGLLHHSSDIDDWFGIVTPNKPHTINQRYAREEYDGE